MNDFKKGDRVRIFNHNQRGDEFIEGSVTIIKSVPDYDNRYSVRFDNGDVVERYVDPERQSKG